MKRIQFLYIVAVVILTACGAQSESRFAFVTYDQLESTYSLNIHDSSGNQISVPGGSSPSSLPDGSLIYSAPGLQEYDQGNRDLWRISPGGEIVNLTNSRMVDEIRPIVSPDGSLIAYFNGAYDGDLCFMKADGTDSWCLSTKSYVYTVNCSLFGQDPSGSCTGFDGLQINPQEFLWNPATKDGDNDLVVVSNWNGEGNKIYRIQLVDGLLAHVNLVADKAVHPSISPDGKLAYIDYKNVNISTINLDGSENQVLISEDVQEISWSPDGTKLAYSSFEDVAVATIYLINTDGSGLEKIIDGYSPVWSPDGTKMLFLRSFGNGENLVFRNHNKLFIYDFSTKTETLIHENDELHLDTEAIFVN